MIVSFKHTRRGFCAEKQFAANLAKKMQLSAQRDPKNNFLTLFQVNYGIKISFFQDLKAFLKKAPSDLFRQGHLLLTSDLITPSRPNPHRRLGGHTLDLAGLKQATLKLCLHHLTGGLNICLFHFRLSINGYRLALKTHLFAATDVNAALGGLLRQATTGEIVPHGIVRCLIFHF